ncbi:putative cytochrome P450 [Aspergillus heteromorphus CBS 117.55]|uniref:Putative cytochrome P450 n=1 Tax=Aspergillus heteromorphus CBS 117.55 TaxID=1448321 RepID=A0A317WPK1_9EURO|nr:putative cytochrome P450 [Aspergillus heteromorphus CBS 117.55]PWY88359.1 putative cytochrome P450 [Aspergillus heteromorphus CBS 117.55]
MLLNIGIISWLSSGILVFLVCLMVKLFETSPVPDGIPWVLKKKNILGRAAERFVGVNPVGFIQDGYKKYSRNQEPFVMPSINEGDAVILPTDQSNTVLLAKENEYSFKAHILDFFQLMYTSWPLAFAEKYDFYVKLISKDLSATLETKLVAKSLADEARSCLSDLWGNDTDDWVEVPLYAAMEKTASRMINVLAIGPGHSHDETLLTALTHCSNAIVFGSNVIKAFPTFLHPIIGPVVGLVNRYFEVIFHRRMKPIIEAKVKEQTEAQDSTALHETLKSQVSARPSAQAFDTESLQGSLLDMLVQAGLRSKWPMEVTSMWLAYRVFMINFPGVHTSGVSATSILLDILSHSADEKLLDVLREEIEGIAINSDRAWTAEDLEKACLLESAVKESLRLNGINSISPTRKVVATDGVTLPNGLFLPRGTNIGIPQYALHRDSDLYPDPDKYDPCRFYTANASAEERQRDAMTTTTDKYVVFGHGRRQCPGRWIFAHIVKVTIAEMLLNYDIKPLTTRPKIHRWGRFQLPPVTTKISVRRKKSTVAVPL